MLRSDEAHGLRALVGEEAHEGDRIRNKKWDGVMEAIESDSPAEWKVAIIKADTMLEDMVRAMGYDGANLGERLKIIERGDFQTLGDAWEAHKVRNRIAHESDFVLTRREVTRTIARYEKVFKEFHYI